MLKWIIAAVGISSFATPVEAHWQWTRWGMTPAQVVAASTGSAELGSGEKSVQGDATKGAVGRYEAGDYHFGVNYWFNTSGLSMVSLSLHDDAQCLGLQRDLLAKYGDPVEHSGGAFQRRMWADKTASNRVVLVSTEVGFCELQYAALVSQAGAAL
jgi:hypothetical protein